MSKWEWIEKACVENGFKRSAIIATELETLLKRLYGNTRTKKWENEYRGFSFHFTPEEIVHLMTVTQYCIACEEVLLKSQGCSTCRLANVDFRCSSNRSLFSQFVKTFWEEWGSSSGN